MVKVPETEKNCRSLYTENLGKLHQYYSREAFLMLLAHGYSDTTEIPTDLDWNTETFAKLCSLIYQELTIANYQKLECGNKALLKDCKEKLAKIIGYMLHNQAFKEFLVMNLM